MNIKAVIFDMDGVLIDSEPLWKQACLDKLNALGIPIQWQDTIEMTGFPAEKVVQIACEKYQIQGLDIQAVAKDYCDYAVNLVVQHCPLFPEVPAMLAQLKSLGIKMAIASASPRKMLEEIVQRAGIADYFDYISSATELPYNKPHPAVYLHAAEKLGVAPQNCLGVEDSVIGMIAVKAASMPVAIVPTTIKKEDPRWSLADRRLSSLSELNQQLLQSFQ